MKTDSFDFFLPAELIAQKPPEKRDDCRLMVLHRGRGTVEHRTFPHMVEYLNEGDLLLLNDTKVLPARLRGFRESGRPLDILLIEETAPDEWAIMSRGGYTGMLTISGSLRAFIENGKKARFEGSVAVREYLWERGMMPLPPYIKREALESDRTWYQTVYARKEGSIAAPTAGLHFTGEMLEKIQERGVRVCFITLHVGIGTFQPLKTDEVEQHRMHSEAVEFDSSVIDLIEETRTAGRRVVSVGTTTTRAIEGYLSGAGDFSTINGVISGHTRIFIYPGYRFRAIDGLLTNFHLPRSTPILLASALAGRETLLRAYAEAIREKYRFFSYGDAMLIL